MSTRVNLLALWFVLAPGALIAQLNPSTLPRIGTVDPRFQSFNVEMLEVTGGRFWAPYNKKTATPAPATAKAATPAGMDPSLYSYRQPIDLASPKLRKLAAALGPAYMRVSGTWANTTFFQDSDAPAPATPPTGFNGVLTRSEWRGVIDFANAVNAEIVTSVAISPGVRDVEGVWTPTEADKFFAFTKSAGGHIAAAEMFNEPSIAAMGGAPKGYDAAAYRKDFVAFHAFAKKSAPGMLILGPGSVGETETLGGGAMSIFHLVRTEDMLAAPTPGIDAFSYHYYGGVSKRCIQIGAASQTTPEAALTKDWLLRTDRDEKFYAALRDRLAPGKPLWVTETGETACGGNPWAADFLDSFRYLVQLGELAKKGVQVVMHNTLAASDYALIDESTLTPRPNYWSALMWHKLMGTTVLDAVPAPAPDLYLYAHCLRNHPGGVALLAINASRTATASLPLPASKRYTLSTADLMSNAADLNGKPLQVEANGDLPVLTPESLKTGGATLAPASITFFAIEDAKNSACSEPLKPMRP